MLRVEGWAAIQKVIDWSDDWSSLCQFFLRNKLQTENSNIFNLKMHSKT